MICTINTDASWNAQRRKAGYAVWIVVGDQRIKHYASFKLFPKNSSIAEAYAVLNALTILKRQSVRPTRTIINCDLNNVEYMLKKYTPKLYKRLRKKIGVVEFRHVKAHVEITNARQYVNDWCDRHAKTGNKNMKLQVFDIETLANLFLVIFEDVKTGEINEFVIHETRNDYLKLREFLLRKDQKYIGYNVVQFDYLVLHPLIEKDYRNWSGDKLARMLFERAQKVIDNTLDERPKPLIEMLDLYLIYHFNNKARSTSLKWLEVCLDWPNVLDMPIDFRSEVTEDQIPTVSSYCRNDVGATKAFYFKSVDKIKFRRSLTETTGVDMTNFSDNKIGENIFLIELEKRAGITAKQLQKTKKFKKEVHVKNIILPSIKFKTPEFQRILQQFRELVIHIGEKKDKTKEDLFTVNFGGLKYDLGVGGCHAFGKPGVYTNVVTVDVQSFYPNCVIGQILYPRHIGPVFCDVEKYLFEERKKYAKGTAENGGIKLALNGGIGQANTEWSKFADSEFFFSITVNCQLMICVLCERIVMEKAATITMVNTDSVDCIVINQEAFDQICKEWQEEFTLVLEFDVYDRIMAPNVNNYIAITKSGKVKEKGSFETKKDIWKDPSMKIVPLAIREYFVNGIPIEDTINNCQDISLFMLGIRAKTGTLAYRYTRNGVFEQAPIQKTNRYYISQEGGQIVKLTAPRKKKVVDTQQISLFDVLDSKEAVQVTGTHVGYRVTLFNVWVERPFEEYGVDKSFYINEALKILRSVGL